MKKRIISLLLALTFAICLPYIPANAASEGYGTEAVTHLINLNIYPSGVESGDYMTRGEFAQTIYNLTGTDAPLTGGYNFGDLAADHINYDAIQYCVQRGYMSGYEGMIRPNDLITYIEGMTVIARVLNYTDYAKYNGDYTLGYYTTAKMLGILKNTDITSSDNPMTYGDAAAMIYNALRCSVNQLSEINSLYYTYETLDRILAYEKLGLNYLSGVMNSNGLVDISGNDTLGKNLVVIDNYKLSARNLEVSYRNYIGQSVSVFYDDDYNVVSIAPTAKNSTVRIKRADFGGYSGRTITYYDNNNTIKVHTSSEAPIFLNGKPVLDFDATGFKNAEFADIYMVDNDGDYTYDAIFVNVYNTFVVHSVDSDGVVIPLNGTTGVNLGEDNGKETVIYDASGNMIFVEDISTNSVISVIESDDFVYAVNVGGSITGTISRIDDYSAVINGLECDIPNGTSAYFKNIKAGSHVTAYFDFDNRIVYVIENINLSETQPFGFIVDCELKTDFDKYIRMRIFTKEGNMEIYRVRNTFTVDDTTYTTSKLSSMPAEFLNEGSVKNTVIMYKTNADGEITEIDFPASYLGEDEDGFIQTYSKYKKSLSSNGSFYGQIYTDTRTVVFSVPEDLNDYELYKVMFNYDIPTVTQTVDAFHFSKNNGFADVIVLYGTLGKIKTTTPMSVVLKVTEGMDEDGNKVVNVRHFLDNKETLSVARDADIMATVSTYKPGDSIRVALLGDTIEAVERVYEYDTGTFTAPTSNGTYVTASIYSKAGYIAYDDNKLFRISDKKDKITTSDILFLDGFVHGSEKIMVVKESSKGVEVTIGTISDINVGDHIVIQARSGSPRYITVYEDK